MSAVWLTEMATPASLSKPEWSEPGMRVLTLSYEFPPIGGGGSGVVKGLAGSLVEMGHTVENAAIDRLSVGTVTAADALSARKGLRRILAGGRRAAYGSDSSTFAQISRDLSVYANKNDSELLGEMFAARHTDLWATMSADEQGRVLAFADYVNGKLGFRII